MPFNDRSLQNLANVGGDVVKSCAGCGLSFTVKAKFSKRIYCSQHCNYTAWKLRDPERYRLYRMLTPKKREQRRKDYIRHKERYKQRARKSEKNKYFSGQYSFVMERDNSSCVVCGMTRYQHLRKYKRDIEMHHIDLDKKNNTVENLQVICKGCHNGKHKRR